VQNYYSREEIAGLKAREIQGVLSSVGITQDVSTKEQFRALVDGLDVNSESGRSQLAALLGLQGDFLQVADFNTETGRTLSGTAAIAPQGGAAAQILANATDAQVVATNTVAQKQDTTNTLLEKIFGAVSNRGGLDAPWKPPAVDYSNVEVGGA
jgi:hypothetical protein